MRKTKLDSMRTRQLLLDTAIEEFAMRGVSNTTLTDIADAAHVTRGAIYWHFSSKTELFNEIWKQEKQAREWLSNDIIINESNEPLMVLRETLINTLTAVTTNAKYRALMEILYHKCEFTEEMISENEIKEIAFFDQGSMVDVLQCCVERGQVSATINISVAIILLQSCLSGIISNWLSQPGAFNLFALRDVLVDNMLKLLMADKHHSYLSSKELLSNNI